MKHRLYSIRDKHIGFNAPNIHANDMAAKRHFKDLCQSGNVISYNTDDFDLYHVGEFDDETGELTAIMPVFVVAGSSYKE